MYVGGDYTTGEQFRTQNWHFFGAYESGNEYQTLESWYGLVESWSGGQGARIDTARYGP